jgi:hypothetical protein
MGKQRHWALFLLALSVAWGACSSSGVGSNVEDKRVFTVSFAENCANPHTEVARVHVKPPATTVEDFPSNPSCPGHRFVEWNTARDGSGKPFTAQTPILFSEVFAIVYAKWERTQLSVEVSPSTLPFSLMETKSHSGRSATLSVVVSGLVSREDADSVELRFESPEWLLLAPPLASVSEGTKTFKVNVSYSGTTFEKEPTLLRLSLANIPKDYEHGDTPRSIRVVMGDGQNHPIPVSQANIKAFNDYAGTKGLGMRYSLVEDVVLEAPLPPETSNWTAIGSYASLAADPFAEAFTGSFDGDGHSISGLVIDSTEDYQGLFGLSGEGAVVENLVLIDLSVKGNCNVGGLVGWNNGGTVQNSHVAGNVEGDGYVGGLVGFNNGTVKNSRAAGSVSGNERIGGLAGYHHGSTLENSYATGSVNGVESVGGLLGENIGLVHGSHATGSVSGNNSVGGLVGNNWGTVQNSHATGSANGVESVGGLVGVNQINSFCHIIAVVENSYATGSVSGSANVGGLVGYNWGTVQNSHATGSTNGVESVGGLVGVN